VTGTERAEAPQPQEEGVARSSGLALATQVTSAAFTSVLVIYLVRRLGPFDYGTFALALGIGNLVVLPADLGISASTARFVAEHRTDHDAVASLVRSGFRLKLIVASAVTGALLLIAPLIADAYGHPGLTSPLRGIAIALLGQSVIGFFAATFSATRRVAAGLRVVAAEGAMETGASIALVAVGAGATGAAFGRAAGYVFGALCACVVARRLYGPLRPSLRRSPAPPASRIGRYAAALVMIDGAFALFQQVDVLVIGGVLGAAAVGRYSAPLRLIVLLHYPGLSVASGVAPRVARGPDGAPAIATLAAALRALLLLQCLIVGPVLAWSGPISHLLLGSRYGESAQVLRAFAPFILLTGLAPLASMAVDYVGEARKRIPIAITTLAVNLAIDLVLIPRIGIVGGAIGTDVAYLIYVPGHLWICHRAIGLPLRALVLTLVRGLLCTGVMVGVLTAVGTSRLSVTQWVLGLLAAMCAFAATAGLTRAISASDVRALLMALSQRRSGPGLGPASGTARTGAAGD
jgi:O-antigen/teichoic acid export membrane protein